MIDKYGRSPLHYAVDKAAGKDVLETLVAANPTMITTACRPKNYQQLEIKEGKPWKYLTPLYLAWVNAIVDKRGLENQAGKILDKSALLLKIAEYGHGFALIGDSDDVPPIAMDSFLREELAPVVIQKVTQEELLHVDPISGKNPLALEASLSDMPSDRLDDFIRMLLEACPRAALVLDREGKTALANAAASGKPWDFGIERILLTAPEAIGQCDEKSGLPPSLPAATASTGSIAGARVEGTNALIADPFGLTSTKAMALRRISLANMQKKKKSASNRCPRRPSLATAEAQAPATKQLSTIYRLIQADPTFNITAVST